MDRLLALSDGVVAIAITLLVLQLNVPSTARLVHPDSASELAAQLGKGAGQLVSYVISFYVIARFWLVHHRVFGRMSTARLPALALVAAMPDDPAAVTAWVAELVAERRTECKP